MLTLEFLKHTMSARQGTEFTLCFSLPVCKGKYECALLYYQECLNKRNLEMVSIEFSLLVVCVIAN